jgi:hypothetical protein
MFMWLADGRMREYEAWSCDDVDSVHNDYQVLPAAGCVRRAAARSNN